MDAHNRIRARAKRATASEARHMFELLNSLGGTIFRQLLWQRASDLDLTYAQSQVLFRLAEHPGSHMGEVAKAFGVTLPAVTHIVDRLEEKGLVTRGDHPADRRVYVLDLTRAGKALVEELEAIRRRGMERVLARMAADDRRRVLTGLEALVDAAESASSDDARAASGQRQAEVRQSQAAVERDPAQLENARVQERRYRELVAKELIAREQYDTLNTNMTAMQATVEADRAAVENAKAALQAAQANIDNARLQLAYTRIHAPIDGRTGNLLVQNGNILKANDDNPIVVINQIHPIYVSFAVPEQHLADIKKYRAIGPLQVAARPPRQQETLATGELTFVNNAVDATTGTIQLKATFANENNVLWPGQFVDVAMVITSRTAIVVPSQAIQPGQQGPYVFVVKPDQTVESRLVKPGVRPGAEAIREKGGEPAGRVVTDGH